MEIFQMILSKYFLILPQNKQTSANIILPEILRGPCKHPNNKSTEYSEYLFILI